MYIFTIIKCIKILNNIIINANDMKNNKKYTKNNKNICQKRQLTQYKSGASIWIRR